MEETKSARFLRVAEPRVNRACKAISLIGNLARGDYEYTDEQANAMIAAMQHELDGVKIAFKRKQETAWGKEVVSLCPSVPVPQKETNCK